MYFKIKKMKSIITRIIKLKNPNFELDEHISSRLILELVWVKMTQLIRGVFIFLFSGKLKKVFVGKGVIINNKQNLIFGDWLQLEDFVSIHANGDATIDLGKNVKIGAFSKLITTKSYNDRGNSIRIGNNVGMGEFAFLSGASGLEIGDDCIIGQYFSCHPENTSLANPKQLTIQRRSQAKGIHIGSNCWIGSKVTILDGVSIGRNCVIAAGAVVSKSMPANSVIGGVPARVLKRTERPKIKMGYVSVPKDILLLSMN